MSTSTYLVSGMTCGHCVSAVTEELTGIPGVTEVAVDLVADGESTVTVTADAEPSRETVAAAVDEAGYSLV